MITLKLPQIVAASIGVRKFEIDKEEVTVGEAVAALETAYPAVTSVIRDKNGELASNIGFYINDEDSRYLGKQAAVVHTGDTLHLIPAVAGG